MILDVHRDALVGGIQRWALGHCPAPQHAVMLQAEVPVLASATRQMLLYDEYRAVLGLVARGRRLARDREVALCTVGADRRVAGSCARWHVSVRYTAGTSTCCTGNTRTSVTDGSWSTPVPR